MKWNMPNSVDIIFGQAVIQFKNVFLLSSTVWKSSAKTHCSYLKGRKPPMAMCTAVCLYQGCWGIWRGMLRVRHGAWKLPALFFPTIPPMTVRGKPTSTQAPSSRSTVVAGRACVDPLHQWTEFTTLQVKKRGAKRISDRKEQREQRWVGEVSVTFADEDTVIMTDYIWNGIQAYCTICMLSQVTCMLRLTSKIKLDMENHVEHIALWETIPHTVCSCCINHLCV